MLLRVVNRWLWCTQDQKRRLEHLHQYTTASPLPPNPEKKGNRNDLLALFLRSLCARTPSVVLAVVSIYGLFQLLLSRLLWQFLYFVTQLRAGRPVYVPPTLSAIFSNSFIAYPSLLDLIKFIGMIGIALVFMIGMRGRKATYAPSPDEGVTFPISTTPRVRRLRRRLRDRRSTPSFRWLALFFLIFVLFALSLFWSVRQ